MFTWPYQTGTFATLFFLEGAADRAVRSLAKLGCLDCGLEATKLLCLLPIFCRILRFCWDRAKEFALEPVGILDRRPPPTSSSARASESCWAKGDRFLRTGPFQYMT